MSPLSPGKNGDFSKTDILQGGHCVGWTHFTLFFAVPIAIEKADRGGEGGLVNLKKEGEWC